MANFTRTILHFVAALLLFVSACSKSVEGEQKQWDANVTEVKGLMAKYPGFKPALEARLTKAQGIFDGAASLGDDAKIEKMAEANVAINRDFVAGLNGLDAKLKKLREKRVEAASKAGDQSSLLGAKVAAQDAAATIERVEAMLATGAADEIGAAAVLDKINADIETAQSAVDKVLGVEADKKQDADKKTADEAKAKADADAKVAPWKCEYCGTSNTHDHTKCSSCGAARSDSKK
jgi:hypothetical protein